MRFFKRKSYKDIENIQVKDRKIGIFGAGAYGKTWAYEIIKDAGLKVDMYFDNNIKVGTVIREEVSVQSIETLQNLAHENKIVVFIAVKYKLQSDIVNQLVSYGIQDVIIMDEIFIKYFVEDVLASGDIKTIERYKNIVDDSCFLKMVYKNKMGLELNLDDPKTLNEKIQWLKLYDRRSIYTTWADKYAVREYIKDNFGNEYLVPILMETSDVEDLTYDKLPDGHFVIKTNHGTGDYQIVRDKSLVAWDELREKYRYYMERNIYYTTREYQYKNIRPRIIVEKLLEQKNGKIPNDYKLHFFNGKCEFVYCSVDREGANYRKVYDTNWKPLNFVWSGAKSLKVLEGPDIPKPKTLKKMLEIGQAISKNVYYVRVDFYDVDGKLYCGEITLHHGAGYDQFFPNEKDLYFGQKLKLELIPNNVSKIQPYKVTSHDIWEMDKDEKKDVIKLDWNESTISPSPMVKKRLRELVNNSDFYQWYPNTNHQKLCDKLAKYLNVSRSNVQVFPSSDMLHEDIMKCWIKMGDTVIIPWPTYDNLRMTVEAFGGKINYLFMKDYKYNIADICKEIEEIHPKMIYICNPNNPTGDMIQVSELKKLALLYPSVMFLIDEAYIEFSGGTATNLVLEVDNIIITRTFSKAFGLANFRIGYMVSSEKNIDIISRIRNSKNITTFSQEAALCALEDIEYMERYVQEVNQSREKFVEFMKTYHDKINVYESRANFILVDTKIEKRKFQMLEFLKNKKIYVRDLHQDILKEKFIRITIGTTNQMEKVEKVIKEYFENEDSSI